MSGAPLGRKPSLLACALLVGAISCSAPMRATACRCVPQTLEHYFEQADIVMIARAMTTSVVGKDPGHVAVEFAPVEKPYKGDPSSIATFATHLSPAGCGMPVTAGQVLLVFASREKRGSSTAWFDTCNGTRRFGPDVAVTDFIDTPADKIVTRLHGLRVGNAVLDPANNPGGPRLPKPGHPGAELIGLLELPSILNLDEPGASSAPPRRPTTPLAVRAEPSAGAAQIGSIQHPPDVVTREYTYEAKGAVVRERTDGWYRIALPDERDGWIAAADAGTFHPLAELVVNRLSYLTGAWDGWTWPEPGAGIAIDSGVKNDAGRQEYPANVTATQEVGGTLWLQVELLSSDPCTEGVPKVRQSGWIPAYSPEGKLTAWFYSRGC